MSLAPIVLFAFNRPGHTLRTLDSLMKNELADKSELFIYCDGPRQAATGDDLHKITEVRKAVRLKQWCAKVTVMDSAVNQTHPVNLVNRVTEIINIYRKIIILEDDLVLGQGFLKYMNEALNLYQNESKVMHISGYLFPVSKKTLPESFFLSFIACWGWGTWKRAWDNFVHDPKELLNKITGDEMYRFNVEGSQNFYNSLQHCANTSWKTWDVRWYATIFIKKGLALYPCKSLVRNIGHDNSGMHSEESYLFSYQQIIDYVGVHPVEIKENLKVRKRLRRLFLHLYDYSFFSFNNFKNICRKFIPLRLYDFLKRKKNEYLIAKRNI